MKCNCHSTTFEWYATSRIISYIDLDRREFFVPDGNVLHIVKALWLHVSLIACKRHNSQLNTGPDNTWFHDVGVHIEWVTTLLPIYHEIDLSRWCDYNIITHNHRQCTTGSRSTFTYTCSYGSLYFLLTPLSTSCWWPVSLFRDYHNNRPRCCTCQCRSYLPLWPLLQTMRCRFAWCTDCGGNAFRPNRIPIGPSHWFSTVLT